MTDPVPAPALPIPPRPPGDDRPGAAWPRVRLAFSTTAEFVAELRARGPNVEPLVRATLWWVRDPAGAPLHELYVVATYLRRIAPDVVALTELRHHAGTVWIESEGAPAPPAEQLARRLLATVEDAARELGAAVGRGAYLLTTGAEGWAAGAAGPGAARERPGAPAPPGGSPRPTRPAEADPWT